MSTFRLLRHIPGAFVDVHFFSCGKMAGADETRRLLRQCASGLLEACHRLERGETESSAAHLQTSNVMTQNHTASNSLQTKLNATTLNRPSANS